MKNLSKIAFKNDFVNNFPGDNSGNLVSRITPGKIYAKAFPTPVPQPNLLAWTEDLAEELQLKKPNEADLKIISGNNITDSMAPYALCYGGHQFGNWAGQLGDGRAITLGEIPTKEITTDLQLKGAGPTAYSRGADGRAVLRSSVREYLISEAMHHLNIPTTRALSLVTTGEEILRDMFYDGHPEYEPGAVISRTATSFLRFGNFEILAARKEKENLQQLVNWTIQRYYPHISGANKITQWFEEIVERTATLMVEWQRVGFVHGVMNTDNMSVLGLSLDYGPFSFLDNYDPNFTPNTTDLPGRRYTFGNQASVAYWNLGRMASALLPLYENTEKLEEALHTYEGYFWRKYYKMMGNKLGLDKVNQDDTSLITTLEEMLSAVKPDMSIFYHLLKDVPLQNTSEGELIEYFEACFYEFPGGKKKESFLKFINDYQERISKNSISRQRSQEIMQKTNPYFILRNYLLHQAIEELEAGNNSLFEKLRKALKAPYSQKFPEFFEKRPAWAEEKAGCSMLSCSS